MQGNEEVIDHWIDKNGIKQEADFMIAEIQRIDDAFQRLSKIRISLQGVTGGKQLSDIGKDAAQAQKDLEGTAQQFIVTSKKIETAYNSLGKSLDDNIKIQRSYKDRLQEIKKELKELESLKGIQGATVKVGDAILTVSERVNQLTKEQYELSYANKEVTATIKSQITESMAAAGSMDEISAKLGQLRDLRRQLSQVDRESPFGQELIKQISALDQEIKNLDSQQGQFFRNVGNYGNSFSGALKILEQGLEDVKKKMDEYNKSGKQSKQVLEDLNKEYSLLEKLLENQTTGFASATAELKNNEKALQLLKNAGLENTEAYQKLLTTTALLKDEVNDLKDKILTLSSDTRGLDGLIQGAQTLAGVYGIAQGAAALFGNENEELQKTFVKLQAVMTVLNGLEAVRNGLKKEGAFITLLETARTKALTGFLVLKNFVLNGSVKAHRQNNIAMVAGAAATTSTTGATKAATVAMIGLRGAIIATGIGALVVLLASAANAMDLFSEKTDKAAGSINSLEHSMSRLNTETDRSLKRISFENNLAIEKAKQRGATDAEISELTINGLKKEAEAHENLAKTKLSIYNNTKDVIGGPLDNLDAVYMQLGRLENIQNSLDENDDKNYKKKVDTQVKALQEIVANDISAMDKRNEIILEGEKFRTIQAEKAIKRSKDYNSKEFKARFEILKLNVQAEIDFYKKQSAEQSFPFETRLNALNIALKKEEQLINAQRAFDLAEEKKTTKERELINSKADEALLKKRVVTAASIINLRKQIAESDKSLIEETRRFAQNEQQKFIDKKIQGFEKELLETQKKDKKLMDQEIQAQLERYRRGEIKKEEFEAAKLGIETKYADKSLADNIKHIKKILDLINLPEEAKEEALKKLDDLEDQSRDKSLNEEKAYLDAKEELHRQYTERIRDLVLQAYDALSEALTFSYDIEADKIRESIDLVEEKKNKDIEFVNQTVQNADERERKIKEIEVRAAIDKQKLEKRQKQLEYDKARFEKQAAILRIAITTAQEIFKIQATAAVLGANPATKLLVPFALAQIPIVIASGAIAAGLIAARPIPKYKFGKGDHDNYEGPAIVGDGQKSELIVREDGSMEVTPNIPTLAWVGKDDTIHPDADKAFEGLEMQHVLKNDVKSKDRDRMEGQFIVKGINAGLKSLEKTVKNKREMHFHQPSLMKTFISSDMTIEEFKIHYPWFFYR